MTQSVSVEYLANLLKGHVEGNKSQTLTGIKPLHIAESQDLSFLEPTAKKKSPELYLLAQKSKAGAILIAEYDPNIPVTQIIVSRPLQSIMMLASVLYPPIKPEIGIHPTAVVDGSAIIEEEVSVGAFVVIGKNCKVGKRSIIYPHVVLYPEVKLGEDCVIHSGAVLREKVRLGNDCLIQNGVIIGSDGFGYIPDTKLGHRRIPHVGTVVLDDRVDLGANATVDKATLGETHIKTAVKVDNLVQIAHNVEIGEASLLCAQVGISGSSKIGAQVVLAGQVGVADHVSIHDKVRIAAKSGVASDINESCDMMGFPAFPAKEFWRQIALIKKLPELAKKIQQQEQTIIQLKNEIEILKTNQIG